MDTTAVNYAINKISEGFQKVMPTLQNVSEKYVHYVVTKEIVEFISSIIFTAFMLIGSFIWYKKFKKNQDDNGDDMFSMIFIILFIFFITFSLIGIIMVFCNMESIWLAITNPEMFTIQKLIESAKK